MQKTVPRDITAPVTASIPDQKPSALDTATPVAFPVLIALSAGHLLNDLMQSLVPAIYPLIKDSYKLDFAQIGMITFVFQLAACLFQPLVGMYNDKRPLPYSVVAAMGFTLSGLIVLGMAGS